MSRLVVLWHSPIIATTDEVIVIQGFGNKELLRPRQEVSEDSRHSHWTPDRTNPHPWSIMDRTQRRHQRHRIH